MYSSVLLKGTPESSTPQQSVPCTCSLLLGHGSHVLAGRRLVGMTVGRATGRHPDVSNTSSKENAITPKHGYDY